MKPKRCQYWPTSTSTTGVSTRNIAWRRRMVGLVKYDVWLTPEGWLPRKSISSRPLTCTVSVPGVRRRRPRREFRTLKSVCPWLPS
jgi:hypothetical protein